MEALLVTTCMPGTLADVQTLSAQLSSTDMDDYKHASLPIGSFVCTSLSALAICKGIESVDLEWPDLAA